MMLFTLFALLMTDVAGFNCYSDLKFEDSGYLEKKGLAVDDTTFRQCAYRTPHLWPNSWEQMTSLRLFRAWDTSWGDDIGRERAWRSLQEFVEEYEVMVLVGTQISCDEEADAQDWKWVQELLMRLTPKRVMGLAIGNELELLHTKMAIDRTVTGGCITRMWRGEEFLSRFKSRVTDLDAIPGFETLPITSVFTGAALYGQGNQAFLNSDNATVNSFLTEAHQAYGERFAYTFNFYPYFDGSAQLDPGTTDSCRNALDYAACWNETCHVPKSIATAREKITALTGNNRSTFWVGETGWSSPRADTLHTPMAKCPAWSSMGTLEKFYSGFLRWDPTFVAGLHGPDHIFWFSIRDSVQFGVKEKFGLVESCDSTMCKIRSPGFTTEEVVPKEADIKSSWWVWAFIGIGALVVLALLVTGIFIRVFRGRVQVGKRRYGHNQADVNRNNRLHP